MRYRNLPDSYVLIFTTMLFYVFSAYNGSAQILENTPEYNTLENLKAIQYNHDSLLTSGYVADEITIPYRSKGLYEQYPAHSLYKKWT